MYKYAKLLASARIMTPMPMPTLTLTPTPNLKMFSLMELKRATKNFRPEMVLGEGRFGTVFKGYIDKKTYKPKRFGVGMPVAVKRSNPESKQGLEELQSVVEFLGKLSHPNFINLLGYCLPESGDKSQFVVYEYMASGSLENHLFGRGVATPISWNTRIGIAMEAARGLAFLHNAEIPVIFRDFKVSRILLDQEFNAKLSGFELAKLGPVYKLDEGSEFKMFLDRLDGLSFPMDGARTFEYAAPECKYTGHSYVKSDVYSFGVVLLEIITGLRVFDHNRPTGQTSLVDWVKPSLPDNRKLRNFIDPRLLDQYPSKAAYQVAKLILSCLEPDPENRPGMDEVSDILEQISTIQKKPKDMKMKSKSKSKENQHQHRQTQPYGRWWASAT